MAVNRSIIQVPLRPVQLWTYFGIAGLVLLFGVLAWQLPGADRLERDVTLP